MYTNKEKIILFTLRVVVAAVLVVAAIFVGISVYLHISANQRAALLDSASYDGPWVEQSVWASSDGQAYLLSQKTNGDTYAVVTAYFYFDEAWHAFRMGLTYGGALDFRDTETNSTQFTGDFHIEDGIFTAKNFEAATDNGSIPVDNTYIFSKSANYEESVSQLPFAA